MSEHEYALELADVIDATMLTGIDAIDLGPTDAGLASKALRFFAAARLVASALSQGRLEQLRGDSISL